MHRPLVITLALLTSPVAAEPLSSHLAERPPRLPSSPRFFARETRPAQPRSSVGLFASHLWGSDVQGVRQREWITGLTVELAVGRFGGFFEVPMVWDYAEAEGVYGHGAASEIGVGDVRFGLDALLFSFSLRETRWQIGVGVQVSAPTTEARQVEPEVPYLPTLPVIVGSARWVVSHGPSLAVTWPWGLTAQVNTGLSMQAQTGELSWHRDPRWFAEGSLSAVYRPLWWLAPMLQLDLQLELYGAPELRQLIFISPGLRLRPHRRLTVDLGLRIPIREETWREHRLSVGVVIALDMTDFFSGAGASGREAR